MPGFLMPVTAFFFKQNVITETVAPIKKKNAPYILGRSGFYGDRKWISTQI
jgi:hypothetical protein